MAQVLADLGHSVTVGGFLGQDNLQPFEALMARRGFADCFVRVPGETRSNLKLVEGDGRVTDINGVGNYDLAPGEIATHSDAINGHVKFLGTFLSTIPFARKYGVLESPLELWIENSTISRIATDVPGLEHDFNKYLDANPSNRRIEELGIGTNEGVKDLYARNAGFEERHCGLHLGLGGGAKGSHHLDLIFSGGVLALDDKPVFDGRFVF